MKNLNLLIDESIKSELDSFHIYSFFKETFIQDADFWKKLADEELNHASILKRSKDYFQGNEVLNIISIEDIEKIIESRNNINRLFLEFKNDISVDKALKLAIQIESSIVESNYQKFMNIIPDSKLKGIFQTLNGDEKNHLKRISEFEKTTSES